MMPSAASMILVEIVDALLVLDLGDDAHGVPAGLGDDPPRVAHCLGAAHERHGEEVDVVLRRETNVCNVLVGDRRQVDPHAGQIDVLPRSQDPAVQHPAAEIALAYFQYLQVDQSVVERDPTTHLQLMHHVLVVDVDGSLLRILGGADGDVELLTDLEG